MGKRLNISGGLSSLIPTGESKDLPRIRKAVEKRRKETGGALSKRGRPKREDKDNLTASSAERGTKPGDMRKTYLVSIELAEKLDAIAYWDRKSVKESITEAMRNYIAAWEKKNGKVKNPPAKD